MQGLLSTKCTKCSLAGTIPIILHSPNMVTFCLPREILIITEHKIIIEPRVQLILQSENV